MASMLRGKNAVVLTPLQASSENGKRSIQVFVPSPQVDELVMPEKKMLKPLVRASSTGVRLFSSGTAVVEEGLSSGGGGTVKQGGSHRDTLGFRLLSLVYPKRSAVIAIRKWKEEGHLVRKYELNRAVRELRKLRRYKHGLEVCEWMRSQPDIKLVPGDYAVHLDLVAKVRGLPSAEKFFEDLPDRMRERLTCSALLHTYVQNNLPAKAEALMEKMSVCQFLKSPLPFNHMLSLYISKGQLEKVPEVVRELKEHTKPDAVTYNLWLTACASQNDVGTAEKVFLELKNSNLQPDWVTYSALSNLYLKGKDLEKAAFCLNEMEKKASKKNRVAYSSLLTLHANMRNKDGVLRIWKKMKASFRKLNDAEYTCMIASLVKIGEIEEGESLYKEWESISPTGDARVANVLLGAYINNDCMEVAENFFHRIMQNGISPFYTTWELLTRGYLKGKRIDKVLECFEKAVSSVKKWDPNDCLVVEVFKNLEELGNIEGAEKMLVILRKAGHVSTRVYNSLIRTYGKAGKMPLIVAERMMKDNVPLDDKTRQLIKLTSKMCVSEVPKDL